MHRKAVDFVDNVSAQTVQSLIYSSQLKLFLKNISSKIPCNFHKIKTKATAVKVYVMCIGELLYSFYENDT